MIPLAKPILLLISLASIIIGLFLVINPAAAIEVQRRFYEKINWRIEPISMQKELRNTKIMGIFLIILSCLLIIYAWIRVI